MCVQIQHELFSSCWWDPCGCWDPSVMVSCLSGIPSAPASSLQANTVLHVWCLT